jgi:hypothetical protein
MHYESGHTLRKPWIYPNTFIENTLQKSQNELNFLSFISITSEVMNNQHNIALI